MNLSARISRLEREAPPPPEPDACPACAGRSLWFKDDDGMDPSYRVACEVCGREPTGAAKVLPRSVEAAL